MYTRRRKYWAIVLVLLLGASLLAGCGSGSEDACATGIRESVTLGNIEHEAERRLDEAVDDGASSDRVDDLRERYREAAGETSRQLRLAVTACDIEGDYGRDRPGSEAACAAAVEVWTEAADDLVEAQSDWASAVRGWDESPGDVSAAASNARSDEPSERLAKAYQARSDAYWSLETATGAFHGSPWAWAACGDSGQVEACARAIDVLDERGRAMREAEQAADARVASYTTPEDDTASVLKDLERGADDLADLAC